MSDENQELPEIKTGDIFIISMLGFGVLIATSGWGFAITWVTESVPWTLEAIRTLMAGGALPPNPPGGLVSATVMMAVLQGQIALMTPVYILHKLSEIYNQ